MEKAKRKKNPSRKPKDTKKNHEKSKENINEKEPRQNEIKINPKLIIPVIIITALALYLYGSQIHETLTTPTNNTNSYTIERGDKVYIRFTQKLDDGTVIDTNYEALAKKTGIMKDRYPPLIFMVGEGHVPRGLEDAVIGMKSGEKKTITLQPLNAYGEYKKELKGTAERIQTKERNIAVSNYESVTSEKFRELFNKRVAFKDDTLSTYATPWNYTITDIKPDNITLKAIIKSGDVYQLPDAPLWDSTAIEVKEDETIFRQDPTDGLIVPTQLGDATITTSEDTLILTINPNIDDTYLLNGIPAKVTELNASHITLDANHQLAGKTIIFDIEILQRVKTNQNTTKI